MNKVKVAKELVKMAKEITAHDSEEKLLGTTRDQLAKSLKISFKAPIENDEWRPLADHIFELVNYAVNRALKNQK